VGGEAKGQEDEEEEGEPGHLGEDAPGDGGWQEGGREGGGFKCKFRFKFKRGKAGRVL
jgi:hypothetical protein